MPTTIASAYDFRTIICECHFQDSRGTFAFWLTEFLRLRGRLIRTGPWEFVNQRWREYAGLSAEESQGWGWGFNLPRITSTSAHITGKEYFLHPRTLAMVSFTAFVTRALAAVDHRRTLF